MISIDFFGCKRDQIVTCSWADACEKFPCTGITLPDVSALTSLSEALRAPAFSADVVPLSAEPYYELSAALTALIRKAEPDELMDAGARWAQLPPWLGLDVNAMDLAGFLLHLHSLVEGPENAESSIFLWMESGHLPVV